MMDQLALRTQTTTGVERETRVSPETLFLYVNQFKAQGARFITITVRDMGDDFQVIYHFEKDNQVYNLYMTVEKEKAVPSITGLYGVAFIAENEAQDLLGLKFSDLNIDLGGRMLKVAPDVGTSLLKTVDGPRPTIMRKLSKCREECPAMVDIPRYIRQVEEGDVEGAYNTIVDRAPLPAILGRVCFAPCQEGCRQELETRPIQIRMLKRYAADCFKEQNGGLLRDVERRASTGKRVAVVGGGPAGVSAAYYLGMLGHGVTLLEKGKTLGGAVLWGIPKYRLPKDVMTEEMDARMTEAGVEVQQGVEVKDLDELMAEGYDACFLAIGAEKCNSLRCEGEDSEGVINFIDFLTAVNVRDETPEVGPRVVVIGGGNSAMDSARTARRLGAEEVTVFYRRTEDEMPASIDEIHGAVEEGIDFDFLSTQLTIHPGKPLRIEYQYMVPGEPDESGRRRPVPMEGGHGFMEADTVIAAIGYNVMVPPGFDVEVDRRGRIVIDDEYRTSREGVYAGGDAAFGTSNVISALRDGRAAASSIDKYLGGEGLGEAEPDMDEFVPRQADLEEIRSRRQARIPELDPVERLKSFAEIEKVYDGCTAECEAGRCWRCDWNE
jgi:NADPH-dependent glutamate synthase beta subunit-like oxidoreductase